MHLSTLYRAGVSMVNQLFYGDNLEVLRNHIRNESVDLCYIDPPFHSRRNYHQIQNNLDEVDPSQIQAFTDIWAWDNLANEGLAQILGNHQGRFTAQCIDLISGLSKVLGQGGLLAYLVSITLRVAEIHRVLKPTGSFYLHCNPTASHYLKLILDTIFCSQGGEFQNEIIWCYSIGGKSKKRFGRKHDVILFYTKSNQQVHTFNEKAATISRKPNSHMKGGIDSEGRQYQEKTDKKTGKVYRYYLDEGKIAEDYWTDIETLNREDRERLGYPTQKPEALLERIIKVSSQEGDVVLDACCGCGTTLAVSQRLNRQWIGIDITYQSISLTLKRLQEAFGEEILNDITLHGMPRDLKSTEALMNQRDSRTQKEFEKWAILTYSNHRALIHQKKELDLGIEGVVYFSKEGGETEKIILQVKSDKVVLRDIDHLCNAITSEEAAMAILLTLKMPTPEILTYTNLYGIYYHKAMNRNPNCVQIVTIREIVEEGKRLEIPLSCEFMSSAEKTQKIKACQADSDL